MASAADSPWRVVFPVLPPKAAESRKLGRLPALARDVDWNDLLDSLAQDLAVHRLAD